MADKNNISRNSGRRLVRTSLCSPNPFLKSPLHRISIDYTNNKIQFNDTFKNSNLFTSNLPNSNDSSVLDDSNIIPPTIILDHKGVRDRTQLRKSFEPIEDSNLTLSEKLARRKAEREKREQLEVTTSVERTKVSLLQTAMQARRLSQINKI